MSTDLFPQLLIKGGAVKWPGVIPVDSARADSDHNNTVCCPVAARLCFTVMQLLGGPLFLQVLDLCAYIYKCTNINKHAFLLPLRPVTVFLCHLHYGFKTF